MQMNDMRNDISHEIALNSKLHDCNDLKMIILRLSNRQKSKSYDYFGTNSSACLFLYRLELCAFIINLLCYI